MVKIKINSKEFIGEIIDIERDFNINKEKIKILKIIKDKSLSLSDIAKILGYSRQKTYYYIKNLKNLNLIKKDGIKYYTNIDLIVIPITNIKVEENIDTNKNLYNFFYPIITEEKLLDGILVVGAPIPHGPYKAIARDIHYSANLAYLLGKLTIKSKENNIIRLDIDVISEKLYTNNLIVLGGPIVNSITYRINDKLAIKFLKEENWTLYSSFSNNKYYGDFIGLIAKIKNPWNKSKYITLFAGVRAIGTKSSLLSVFKNKISVKSKYNEVYYVVEGVDKDGDGKIDDVEILEKVEIK